MSLMSTKSLSGPSNFEPMVIIDFGFELKDLVCSKSMSVLIWDLLSNLRNWIGSNEASNEV
jgi:hypothetical protein